MQRGPSFAAPIAKAFSIHEMQNFGITQKMNGSIKAQAMRPWRQFSLLEPRAGLLLALVLPRHAVLSIRSY